MAKNVKVGQQTPNILQK